MPILKPCTMPNHASAEYHLVKRLEFDFVKNAALLSVLSFPTEAAYLAGVGPLWNSPLAMPPSTCGAPLLDTVEAWLLADAASPFLGGLVVLDQSASLEATKARKWAEVKVARDAALAAGFTYDGSVFDSDDKSVTRLTGAAVLAMMATSAGQPYSASWTLADNSVRTLNATEMMAVGVAAGSYVQKVIDQGQALRQQLDAAATIDEVERVLWPVAQVPA